MAAANATVFPVYATTYPLYGVVKSSLTGNPITGGLTGLSGSAVQISKDEGAFANCTNAPVENGTTGYFYLDLTAAEMTCTSAIVRVLATNANAIEFSAQLLTSQGGRIS